MTELEKELNAEYVKLKNFKAFKNWDKERIIARIIELRKDRVEKKIVTHDKDMDIDYMFIDLPEKRNAYKLLGKYLEAYSIDSVSDKNTLKLLIYYEVIIKRIQILINTKHKAGKAESLKLIEELNRIVDKITQLKELLGLNADKTSNSAYEALELLKKKAASWRKKNQGSRTLICPHCGQMTLLKIRMDKWDAVKHPFFKDRVLTNKHLLKLYLKGTITTKDIALILECSTDYTEWVLKKHYSGVNALKSEIV